MSQIPSRFQTIIDRQVDLYGQRRTIEIRNRIPPANTIPLNNRLHWFRIPDVISVFVDMKGSTQLSAQRHERGTAGAYQLFTGTAVDLFHDFGAPYIDVRGDGVFALFNQDQVYLAFAAAVTFKTFADDIFVPKLQQVTGMELGAHIGIDQRTVLVRRIGLRRQDDRTDRQNEVWAGKPVNMSSKLAAMAGAGELLVSDRYYNRINHERVRKSCGCPDNEKKELWTLVSVKDDLKFDFDTAYCLESRWCETHGEEYCHAIMALDASARSGAKETGSGTR
jgi:class 3 adenylate cyclase